MLNHRRGSASNTESGNSKPGDPSNAGSAGENTSPKPSQQSPDSSPTEPSPPEQPQPENGSDITHHQLRTTSLRFLLRYDHFMSMLSPSKDGVMQVGKVMRAPKTAELIATHLRRQIVRGELQVGETLPPEVELMSQYGVSRPTLREAFRILETETLISVRRGSRGGAQVIEPDISVAARYVGLLLQISGTTIVDVYEARTVSEPECARLLARARTKDDIADLRACIEEVRAVVEAGVEAVPDPGRWSGLTYRFHELIMQRCGNKTLAVQGAVLHDIATTHMELSVANKFGDTESPARFQRVIKAYEKLTDLVEAKDADGAAEHWRKHMDVAAKYLFANDLKNKSVVDLFA